MNGIHIFVSNFAKQIWKKDNNLAMFKLSYYIYGSIGKFYDNITKIPMNLDKCEVF
jgi:hypothetical protein